MLLIDTYVSRIHKASVNDSSANTILSKTLLRYHSLPLMKNVLKWFSKLIVTASAANAGIHKKSIRIGGTNKINNFKWRNGWYHKKC